MTTKLLLRTVALTCAWLLGATTLAQTEFLPHYVHYDCTPTSIQEPNVKHYSSSSYQETSLEQVREQARKLAAKAEGNPCTITLDMRYDPEVYEAPYFAYILDDKDIVGVAFDNGQGALQGQVPPGVYDIVSQFTTEDHSQYYVIYEQQNVTGDLTLTLDPTTCTNSITVNNYGPDGELLKPRQGHYDEDGAYVIDEEGDYYHIDVDNHLCRKGGLWIYSFSVGGVSQLGFHVNDVSDRFYFRQLRFMHSEDLTKSYVCYFSTDNLTTSVVENNPNDYVQQVYDFKYTPRGREQLWYGISDCVWMLSKKVAFAARGASTGKAKLGDVFTHEVWANIPETNPYELDEHIAIQLIADDYGDEETITFGEHVFNMVTTTAWILSPAMGVNNGHKESINIGHHEFRGGFMPNNLYAVYDDGNIFTRLLPAPEPLTYSTELAEGLIGDNCPINALKVTSYLNENDNTVYLQLPINYFVSRNGESYCCQDGTTMTAKFRGNEIDLETFSPDGLGTYEFTVDNPIFEVDGLPAHNITTVFLDQNQEDMNPPSLEMLHFKNVDGKVTDRFATAADGTMEFYASDFDYQYFPKLWGGVYLCQPVEVVVEYAPYGTEDWNELAVEEIPEYYQEPGWGYFYRGTLDGVTGLGQNGWFDLRFRLQDESGNWQEQVVSPAFRIDDLAYSSVATITPNKAGDNTIYNLAGQRMRGDLNTLPHGVYIVGGKKVVK